jgi:hypothetical protein
MVVKGLKQLGLTISDPHNFTDYSSWIRFEPARSTIISFLNNPDALYTEYLPKDKGVKDLNDHLHGERVCTQSICRTLTFEIWLEQVFNKRYRSG